VTRSSRAAFDIGHSPFWFLFKLSQFGVLNKFSEAGRRDMPLPATEPRLCHSH
jgi:hypothetical protein